LLKELLVQDHYLVKQVVEVSLDNGSKGLPKS
jgi:hypothetical protein